MSRFTIAAAAEADLASIRDYLVREAEIGAAEALLANLYSAMDVLADAPGVGRSRVDLTSEPVRFHLVSRYFIIYVPDENPIAIVRVLHTARDIKKLLARP